jgi:hypothetical protein
MLFLVQDPESYLHKQSIGEVSIYDVFSCVSLIRLYQADLCSGKRLYSFSESTLLEFRPRYGRLYPVWDFSYIFSAYLSSSQRMSFINNDLNILTLNTTGEHIPTLFDVIQLLNWE